MKPVGSLARAHGRLVCIMQLLQHAGPNCFALRAHVWIPDPPPAAAAPREWLPLVIAALSTCRECPGDPRVVLAQAVMSGVQDVVVAAGVEHMSSVPIGANVVDSFKAGHGRSPHPRLIPVA